MAETIEAAEALFAQGQIPQAQAALEALNQIHPQDPRILNDLGVIFFVQEEFAQAEGYFLRSLEVDDDNGQAMANLADVYRKQSRWAEAIGWIQRQIEKLGESTDLLNELAVAYLEMGQPELARPVLVKSLEMDPDQGPVKQSLGMLDKASQNNPIPPAGTVGQAELKLADPSIPAEPSDTPIDLGINADSLPEAEGPDAETLVDRICRDRQDREAFQSADKLVANRSLERLRRNEDMSWLRLAVGFDQKRWGTDHLNLLGQWWSDMDPQRQQRLLDVLLDDDSETVENVLHVILKDIKELPAELAEKLGRWADKAEPTRICIDHIERAICLHCDDVEIVRRIGRYETLPQPLPFDEEGTFLPRRLAKPIQPDEEFCKQVRPSSPDKEGGMRILLLAETDVHGCLGKLARALNSHTRHVARCVVLQQDDSGYDTDLVLRSGSKVGDTNAVSEVMRLISEADFFHFGRKTLPLQGVRWDYYISKNNSLVQYFGEYMRNHTDEVQSLHGRSGITAVTSGDRSLARITPYPVEYISPFLLEPDSLPQGPDDYEGPIGICHSPSSSHYREQNHSQLVWKILEQMQSQDPQIQIEQLAGLSNAECLSAKSRHHIHFVSLGRGLGMGAIESAAMGVVPVLRMTNAWRAMYPDCPFVHVDQNTAEKQIRQLLDDRQLLAQTAQRCRKWALEKFDVRRALKQYAFLYDLIVNGLNQATEPVCLTADRTASEVTS